jgi:hypothetical protein
MKYGANVVVDVALKLQEQNTDRAVRFDTTQGIIIGDTNLGDLKTFLTIYCSNESVHQELALELDMDFQMVVNATFKNFVVYAQASSAKVAHTVVATDNVSMMYHDYDSLLTAVLNSFVTDFNMSHSSGIDLKQKYPTLKFVAGMLQATLLTPF